MDSLLEESITFAGCIDQDMSATIPERCSICGNNPSVLEYQKHSGGKSLPLQETGYCCTACAFNMIVALAQHEIDQWLAMAGT